MGQELFFDYGEEFKVAWLQEFKKAVDKIHIGCDRKNQKQI
jgi:hypothetical protein